MGGFAAQTCPVGVVDYIESPTATNLRDALLELYLMEAYVAPPAVVGGIEFEDRDKIDFEDRGDIDFEDRT